jgi:epoxyqueuosine reductase QueG
VAVAIGNAGAAEHLVLLEELARDEDPIVREHAAWGLQRLRDRISGQDGPGSGRV